MPSPKPSPEPLLLQEAEKIIRDLLQKEGEAGMHRLMGEDRDDCRRG